MPEGRAIHVAEHSRGACLLRLTVISIANSSAYASSGWDDCGSPPLRHSLFPSVVSDPRSQFGAVQA